VPSCCAAIAMRTCVCCWSGAQLLAPSLGAALFPSCPALPTLLPPLRGCRAELFSPSKIPRFLADFWKIPMPGAEVSRDPRAVAKGSSGSPRAALIEISGTPSGHKHSVGGPLSCERSECQGDLWAQPPRRRGLGAQLHAAVSIENINVKFCFY
jgi:hypothetical protein